MNDPSRRNLAWLVVAVVMASAATAQAFGRFTYGVLLPDIRADLLGGSYGVAGAIGTVNVSAYLLGTLAVSWLASRVDQITLLRVGLVLSTGGLATASLTPNGWMLGLTLFATGLGGAMIWIPSPRVAAMALPPHQRGLGVGLVGTGIGVGIVAAGWLSGVMRDRYGLDGWRMVYRVEAAFGVAVLVLGFAVFRPSEVTTGSSGGFGGLGALRTIPGWKALTAAYAAFGFFYLLVVGYLVARLEDDAGFSEARASAMFSLFGLGAAVGGLLLGPASDRFGRRNTMIAGFLGFALATAAVMTGQELVVVVGSFTVGVMFSGIPSAIAAYVVDATTPERYGQAYAAATIAFGLAQSVSPSVGGVIADATGSFTPVFSLAIVVACVAAVVAGRLPHDSSTLRGAQ